MSATCLTCQHWKREEAIFLWGPEPRHHECGKIERDALVFAGRSEYDYIATRDDFGCNQWEERVR